MLLLAALSNKRSVMAIIDLRPATEDPSLAGRHRRLLLGFAALLG